MATGPSKEQIYRAGARVKKSAAEKFPGATIGYIVHRASNGEAAVFATVNGKTYVPWLVFEYEGGSK